MKTIKENNKLIAEFMGEKFTDSSGVVQGLNYKLIEKKHGEGNNGFRFHTSWDWLMPVVEKILDISFQDEGDAEDFYSIRDCMPDINHTYKAVVQFINQYNNQ